MRLGVFPTVKALSDVCIQHKQFSFWGIPPPPGTSMKKEVSPRGAVCLKVIFIGGRGKKSSARPCVGCRAEGWERGAAGPSLEKWLRNAFTSSPLLSDPHCRAESLEMDRGEMSSPLVCLVIIILLFKVKKKKRKKKENGKKALPLQTLYTQSWRRNDKLAVFLVGHHTNMQTLVMLLKVCTQLCYGRFISYLD